MKCNLPKKIFCISCALTVISSVHSTTSFRVHKKKKSSHGSEINCFVRTGNHIITPLIVVHVWQCPHSLVWYCQPPLPVMLLSHPFSLIWCCWPHSLIWYCHTMYFNPYRLLWSLLLYMLLLFSVTVYVCLRNEFCVELLWS